MVVSHERSGTHFLMNSLALCFGYIADPWANFDVGTLPFNFYSYADIREFFRQLSGRHLANILKSHHPIDFFAEVMPEMLAETRVFYVYRDPRDVMVSFWRYLNRLRWNEGPKTDDLSEFIRLEPAGHIMRYQYRQEPSMLHRWRTHVDGWMTRVPPELASRVTFVRYQDLVENYEGVIRQAAAVLGPPVRVQTPPLSAASVMPTTGQVGTYRHFFDEVDLTHFRDVLGPTLDRLGFT